MAKFSNAKPELLFRQPNNCKGLYKRIAEKDSMAKEEVSKHIEDTFLKPVLKRF